MDKMEKQTADIYDVDESDFQSRVVEASHEAVILVDFWAAWCAPCIALAPALVRLVKEYPGEVRLAKVEVDDNMRLAGHYRLRGFPTVILFREGVELGRFSGARSVHWMRDWLQAHL